MSIENEDEFLSTIETKVRNAIEETIFRNSILSDERPEWHILKENPNDLPPIDDRKDDGKKINHSDVVYCIYKDGTTDYLIYDYDDEIWIRAQDDLVKSKDSVIAWTKIFYYRGLPFARLPDSYNLRRIGINGTK